MIRFLDGNASLFSEAAQERYFLQALETEYRRIREWVEDEFIARGLYGKEEGAVGEDRTDVADGVIAKRLEFWWQQEDAEYFKGVRAEDVVGRISGGAHEVVNRVFLNATPNTTKRPATRSAGAAQSLEPGALAYIPHLSCRR